MTMSKVYVATKVSHSDREAAVIGVFLTYSAAEQALIDQYNRRLWGEDSDDGLDRPSNLEELNEIVYRSYDYLSEIHECELPTVMEKAA
jgi:hypothetical protein